MGTRKGPVKIKNYGLEFKLRAVQLSSQPGVLVKDVAESLRIHPFMLSKWRKQVRDGELSGSPPPVEANSVAELQRLREMEKQFKRLQMENDLLKKSIRFASELRASLLQQVRTAHERSRGYYGSPRVTGQLRLDGHPVGRTGRQAIRWDARVARPSGGTHGSPG